jgi:hypothetical protein
VSKELRAAVDRLAGILFEISVEVVRDRGSVADNTGSIPVGSANEPITFLKSSLLRLSSCSICDGPEPDALMPLR